MSKVLMIIRRVTKEIMLKDCELSTDIKKTSNIHQNREVIIRCLSDPPNRTYSISPIMHGKYVLDSKK